MVASLPQLSEPDTRKLDDTHTEKITLLELLPELVNELFGAGKLNANALNALAGALASRASCLLCASVPFQPNRPKHSTRALKPV